MLLLIVVVPDAEPMLSTVAAPPILSVVALVLNSVAVPTDVVVTSAPLTARSPVIVALLPTDKVEAVATAPVVPSTVKFDVSTVIPPFAASEPVTVTVPVTDVFPVRDDVPVTARLLFTVVVPVEEPMDRVVAAPPILSVVATVLKRFCVVLEPTTVPGRTVTVALVADPRVNAVAAPNAFTVVAVVLNKSKEVDPVVTLVVKFGDVPNTKTPVPVSSEITPASSLELVAEKNDNLFVDRPTVPVKSWNVTVLSAVGSVIKKVVSNASAVAPSKTIELSVIENALVLKFDSVGLLLKTTEPVPVEVVVPVPPFKTGTVSPVKYSARPTTSDPLYVAFTGILSAILRYQF
jgi:hypothetical protein